MSNFILNKNKKLKDSIKDRTIQNNFVGKQNTLIYKILPPNTFEIKTGNLRLFNISPTLPADGISFRYKQPISVIKVNNYAKILRIRKDTTPVRSNLYDYINSVFKSPIIVDKYEFCYEQKISSIFSTNGDTQWYSTYSNRQSSFKTALFNKVSYAPLSISDDCSCRVFNFNGIYTVDRRLTNENNLIETSNKNMSKISFNLIDNYILISFYSYKTKSFVKIRLRPPLRYRPIYNDWVFDDKVIIDNIMSLTEYAEIIDCCQPFDGAQILNKFK